MSLRSIFQRKTRNYDSDSTGYGSSSDNSSPLTASQFILRPVTVLSSYSNHSPYEKACRNYYIKPGHESSSWSSQTTSENEGPNGSDFRCLLKRYPSAHTTNSSKSSTSSKLAACKSAFSSLKIRPKKARLPLFQSYPSDESTNTDDFLDFNESISSTEERENASIDDLFNALKMKEDPNPLVKSRPCLSSTVRRKHFIIKKPDDSSSFYFDYWSKKRKPSPYRSDSPTPRPLSRKDPSLCYDYHYEKVRTNHLTQLYHEFKPEPLTRPFAQPMRLAPPCHEFYPRQLDRVAPLRRRQKLPTLQQMDSQSTALLSLPCRLRRTPHPDDRV